MFQAPASVWNQIAETQDLRTEWANLMFPLPQDQLDLAVESELQRVKGETGSPVVAAAYLLTMPLLWEVEAIRNWQEQTGQVLPSLPILETVPQAMAVARGDYLLDQPEAEILRRMLLLEPRAQN